MSPKGRQIASGIATAAYIVLTIFAVIVLAMLTYDAIIRGYAWKSAETSEFYRQCHQSLTAATWPRVVATHIDNICAYAA